MKKICKYPGCCNTAELNGYCNQHQIHGQQIINAKQEAQQKIENIKIQMLRAKYDINRDMRKKNRWIQTKKDIINSHPYCAICGAIRNLEVHHIIKPDGSEELFYNKDNLIVLCKECHKKAGGVQKKNEGGL